MLYRYLSIDPAISAGVSHLSSETTTTSIMLGLNIHKKGLKSI